MAEYTYKAFISYSWADTKWGKWFQQAVETYRTPKALIEKHAGMRGTFFAVLPSLHSQPISTASEPRLDSVNITGT